MSDTTRTEWRVRYADERVWWNQPLTEEAARREFDRIAIQWPRTPNVRVESRTVTVSPWTQVADGDEGPAS